MIRFVGPLFFMLLVISACSTDDGSMDEAKSHTNLKIIVTNSEKEPVADVKVTTEPKTKILVTDDEGIANFVDLSPGIYTIFITPPDDYTYETDVEVRLNEENRLDYTTLDLSPVAEVPLDYGNLLKAVYTDFQKIYNARFYVSAWGDIGSDIFYVNQNKADATEDMYRFSPNNSVINLIWNEHYSQISLINYGLNELRKTNEEQTNTHLKTIEAELRFVRALLNFNLVKMYGNPIVATYNESTLYEPSSVIQDGDEVYDRIIKDLQFAEQYLESLSQASRASQEAAQALLGKVYLQSAGFPLKRTENYAKALGQFSKLEAKFELEADYASIFKPGNDVSEEVIFKIDFEDENENLGYGYLWGPQGLVPHDILRISQKFIRSYLIDSEQLEAPVSFPLEIKDSRFYTNIATFKHVNGQKENAIEMKDWRPYKFAADTEGTAAIFDLPLLRYADILLMTAEAENAINGPTEKAYSEINKVRRRAFGTTNHDLPRNLNTTEFLEAILAERSRELCYEGHRKDDLIRNERLASSIADFNNEHPDYQRDYQDYKYIWPIPQEELSFNPYITQNPGY
ncbi:MAG TPA: RagB/SusD family nutrient uptake outer membrane protein [Leeuwenhoekiella sp.]|nr:RagB/SusD family nutrient uptake outer membrane protein [Leeuwenhoekiella sp.]